MNNLYLREQKFHIAKLITNNINKNYEELNAKTDRSKS